MKKLILIFAAFLVLLAAALLTAWWNLPRLCSYAISRLAGGNVEIGQAAFSYKDGLLGIDLRDLKADGQVKGTAKRWEIVVNPRYGLHLNRMALTGFDLTISDLVKGRKTQYTTPTDLLEVKDGILRYTDQVFEIKELRVERLRAGRPFQYRVEVRNDAWFGLLRAHGEGVYKGKASELRGRVSVTRMDMGRWDLSMEGIVDGEGAFTYGKDGLSADGRFKTTGYELKLSDLKDPRFHDLLTGSARLTYHDGKTGIHIRDVMFKGARFTVDIGVNGPDITYVDLTSGEVAIEEVRQHVDLEKTAEGASRVWDYIGDGRVAIARLAYAAGRSTDVDLYLRGVHASYKGMAFSDIEGALRLGEKEMHISGMKGCFKESMLTGVSASYTYADHRLDAAAHYSVSLRDVAPVAGTEDLAKTMGLTLRGGIAEGTISVASREGSALAYSGSGGVRGGDIVWKGAAFSVSGAYRFTGESIVFDPLMIAGDGTDLALSGTFGKSGMDLAMKGRLAVAHLGKVVALPVKADGVMDIDLKVRRQDPAFTVAGTAALDRAAYEIPNLMKKDRGIANTVSLDLSREGDDIRIRRLRYMLDAINVDLSGRIGKDRRMDLDVAMKIDGFERVAKIFLIEDNVARGDADMAMSVRGLDLRSSQVPFMTGHINVNNGFIRLPWMKKPFKEIKLKSVFRGDAFDVKLERFVCGESVLTGGSLRAEGRDAPRFSLSLDMDNLKLADFADELEFKVSPLRHDNALAHANGAVSLKAKKVALGKITGKNLALSGMLADRKLSIPVFKADVLGGSADLHGNVDFSDGLPRFSADGRIDNLVSHQVLEALGAKTQIIDSTGMVYGSLNSRGEKPGDWLYNLDGVMTFLSRGGVIKKWNLLSKVFGVLNIYDLVRGKVDLAAEGLPFTKMGASFVVKDGVFRTTNFLIDSPSMLITGAGEIDVRRKEIKGGVTVSPLVAIDTMIDKVPVIRSLLKKKTSGFLYASYDVKGPLDDPEVKVSFVDTVAGKTLELIKNVLTLPIGVFQ